MMWPVRLAWWVVNMAVGVALSLLGVVVVGYLAVAHAWEQQANPRSQETGALLWQFRPRWAWLWSNDELGIAYPGRPLTAWNVFVWTAWRNRVSNLRFVRPWYCRVDVTRLRSAGTLPRDPYHTLGPGWAIVWQGVYAGVWIRGWTRQFRIGFTLIPADADALNPNDLRQMYAPFSFEPKQSV